jgi:PrcB C-terminal
VGWVRVCAVAFLIAALATGCGAESRRVAFTDVTKEAGALEFTRITRGHYRAPAALLDVISRNNPGRPPVLPPIDFSRESAYLVAAGPRSSSGYELQIVSVQDEGDEIKVVVRERTPSLSDHVIPGVTYPFRLLALPRTDDPVKLKWLGRP